MEHVESVRVEDGTLIYPVLEQPMSMPAVLKDQERSDPGSDDAKRILVSVAQIDSACPSHGEDLRYRPGSHPNLSYK